MNKKIFTISTGSRLIDSFLNGGIRSQELTHIYGPPGSGKTTFALQLVVNICLRGLKTIYVDSDSTLFPERIKQIAGGQFGNISDRILVYRPASFAQQSEIIESLKDYLSDSIKLIVVDTITSLYRVELTGSKKNDVTLNIELNRQLAILLNLARKFNLVVVTVNQVRRSPRDLSEVEPAAKSLVEYWCNTSIMIKQLNSLREAIVKTERGKKNFSVKFKLDTRGIMWIEKYL
ncbi:MAG: ATPase domain-containing protein [Candidatus Odinarchaeia archaeon]